MRRADRRALIFIMVAALSVWSGVLLERHMAGRARKEIKATAIQNPLEEGAELYQDGSPQSTSQSERNKNHLTIKAFSSLEEDGGGSSKATLFTFDPNTADSVTLTRLGFTPWQVRNIYKYRARGGRYRRTEDLKRLYGMTPELYERLAPYVRIDRRYKPYDEAERAQWEAEREERNRQYEARRHEREARDQARHDSIARRYPRQEKFETLVELDLNSVDTTTLKHVPGIASYRARQIVRYRERLGGFVSTAQLAEIEGFPADELEAWFKVEPGKVSRIDINRASVREMGRHPYIGFERARAIENYRRNQGRINNLDDLSLLPAFTPDAIERMKPYVSITP